MEPDELMDSYLDGVIDAMLEMRNAAEDACEVCSRIKGIAEKGSIRLYYRLRSLDDCSDISDWNPM